MTPTTNITFSAVTTAGETTVTPVNAAEVPVAPTGQSEISAGAAYEVTTTAAGRSPRGGDAASAEARLAPGRHASIRRH